MTDLTVEMAQLVRTLSPHKGKKGRALMFVASNEGEGVSTVAREFSRCEAAVALRPVWLIDADLANQTQLQAVLDEPMRYGPPGPVSKASPDDRAFFTVTPKRRLNNGHWLSDADHLVARPFLDQKLMVSRFRNKYISPGQKVRIVEDRHYIERLKNFAQTIVFDAPALERSTIGLSLAPLVDGIILVVSEGVGMIDHRIALKQDLIDAGGKILGVVYNNSLQKNKVLAKSQSQ